MDVNVTWHALRVDDTDSALRLALSRYGRSHRAAIAPTTTRALAAALLSREPHAAATAWTRLSPMVRSLLGRFFGGRPGCGAPGSVSGGLLRFFARIDELRDPKALRNFLIGICLGVAQNELRRTKTHRWMFLTSSGELPEVPIEPGRLGVASGGGASVSTDPGCRRGRSRAVHHALRRRAGGRRDCGGYGAIAVHRPSGASPRHPPRRRAHAARPRARRLRRRSRRRATTPPRLWASDRHVDYVFGAGRAQRGDGAGVVAAGSAVDRRARDQHVRARRHDLGRRCRARCRRRPRCRRRSPRRSISARSARILGTTAAMNACPPKPGFTVITSTRSTSRARSEIAVERRGRVERDRRLLAQRADLLRPCGAGAGTPRRGR